MFEGNQAEQLFADIIIDVVKSKYQKYEREHRELGNERVPLENIHFWIVRTLTRGFDGIGDFHGNTGIPELSEIAKIQKKPNENLLITAQHMLDHFCSLGEIEKTPTERYKLSTGGTLYQYLTQELASS